MNEKYELKANILEAEEVKLNEPGYLEAPILHASPRPLVLRDKQMTNCFKKNHRPQSESLKSN